MIILIVTTAVLLAWLLVGLTRVGLGDLRLPRLRESSVGAASPSGPPASAVPGSVTEHAGSESDTCQSRRQDVKPRRQRRRRREEQVRYDASDVEQAVRDRLYGRYGRRD